MESTDNPIIDFDFNSAESAEKDNKVEKKHKIDARKLIIYSEIMKPKFEE